MSNGKPKPTPKKSRSRTPKSKTPQSNNQRKGKSDYPGPSKKLHKTSLPLLEDIKGKFTRISDAETDAELDVCGDTGESRPRKRKRKRYKGSLDKLHSSAKKKRALSPKRSDESVCLDDSVVAQLCLVVDRKVSKKRRKSHYKSRGSLDVVASVKAKSKAKARERAKREKSSTITSAEDLVLADFSKEFNREETDINSNDCKMYFEPNIDTSDVDSGILPLKLELGDMESAGEEPPVLSPPIDGVKLEQNSSVLCKFEDLPPLLLPQATYKSKIPRNDPCATGNRQSPRLSANKKFQRRKSAIERMKSPKKSKERRSKSLHYMKNQPSIMKWFHSNRMVSDECQAVKSTEEMVVQSHRKSGRSPCQFKVEPPSQTSATVKNRKEKKTLVIKWRDKQIIVKPTGKEIVTLAGKKIASSKTSKMNARPICAVAPSPRSRNNLLPETCPTLAAQLDKPVEQELVDQAEMFFEESNSPAVRGQAICMPISVSSPSNPVTAHVVADSNNKSNIDVESLTLCKRSRGTSGNTDSPRAKCSLAHRYPRKESSPAVGQTAEIFSMSQFCSPTSQSFEYDTVSRSVVLTNADKYSTFETRPIEQEEDLEISFKSDVAELEDTREVVLSRHLNHSLGDNKDLVDSIDDCMNVTGQGWRFVDMGCKNPPQICSTIVRSYNTMS